jgi:hypothetical protein
MFYKDRPRMLNTFRDQAEANFFAQYLELPTMPVLVTDMSKLSERTWETLVFLEVTEERVVLREDMNRDVFLVSSMLDNTQKQFEKLKSSPPLFATFHINPLDSDPVTCNNELITFLSTLFP